MNSGIYKITNTVTNKIYIGSAKNLDVRWITHKYALNENRHSNIYLQNAWNKYWEISFKFEILECCEIVKLIEREQYWLDFTKCYDREIGYNILKFANSTLGSKRTEETKAKMSAWQIGRQMSDEAKTKMSDLKRDVERWPCLRGSRCECESCKDKKREYKKLKAREYRTRQREVA